MIKGSIWYSLANVLPFISSFILLPIYTSYLTVEDYGIIALVSSLSIFLSQFFSLQLGSSILRLAHDYKENELPKIVSTLFFSIMFIGSTIFFFNSFV